MIKVSDYIARFLVNQGVDKVFAIQGGASAHLIDSIAKCDGIEYICNQHEQASAMAADGYARVAGKLGVAIATSGPGATNLLTGCCSSYYDSIPVLLLTGQVASFRNKGSLGIRQLGFQETDTISIFQSVVKYCVLLKRPEDIRYELEKAVYIATHGRKGPVLIDIPDDYQRAMINESDLRPYEEEKPGKEVIQADFEAKLENILQDLNNANRPLILAGRGIHLGNAEKEFYDVVRQLDIPVVFTWGANDLLDETDELKVGTIGINGTRYGNFAVQKADFILVLGSRLDTHTAGTPLKNFGKNSDKIIVDIDQYELAKYKKLGFDTKELFQCDVKEFLLELQKRLKKSDVKLHNSTWIKEIERWKEKYPVCASEYYDEAAINPYVFVKKLSEYLLEDDIIFCDTGCSLVWMNQAFEFKKRQRIYSSFNNTPMGYSLPAAIGAALATNKRIICVTGDGGLQMNLQELATVIRHNINMVILLFENRGYGMIQRTQDMWFESVYEGSDIMHGLAFPDFELIFKDYGFKTKRMKQSESLDENIQEILSGNGPRCGIIEIGLDAPMLPQVKFGHDLEDMEPYLSKEIVEQEIIV